MRGGRARFNIGASLHTCGLAELEDIALSLEDIALSLEDIAISLPLGAAWRWMQRYAVYLSKILLYLSKILLYLSKILLYLSKILLYLDFISSNHSPHVRHRYTRSPPPHYLPLSGHTPWFLKRKKELGPSFAPSPFPLVMGTLVDVVRSPWRSTPPSPCYAHRCTPRAGRRSTPTRPGSPWRCPG